MNLATRLQFLTMVGLFQQAVPVPTLAPAPVLSLLLLLRYGSDSEPIRTSCYDPAPVQLRSCSYCSVPAPVLFLSCSPRLSSS
jgi:hypothetical protein